MKKLILLLLCLGLMSACSVDQKEIKIAEILCENNGGISKIRVDWFINDVKCKNGAYFNDIRYNTKGK